MEPRAVASPPSSSISAMDALIDKEGAPTSWRALPVCVEVLELIESAHGRTVHGERLSTLIANAKAEDDKALDRAAQIEPRTLTSQLFFNGRYERAANEDHDALLEMLFREQIDPLANGGRRARICLSRSRAWSGMVCWFHLLESGCSIFSEALKALDHVKNLRKLLARTSHSKIRADGQRLDFPRLGGVAFKASAVFNSYRSRKSVLPGGFWD